MELKRSRQNYFDDVANYLITLISLSLTAELYIKGTAGKYSPNHIVQLDAKQAGKRLRFYTYTLLNDIFQLKWPTTLSFEEKNVTIDPKAVLNLGALERPLYAFAQSMFVNYFERYRPDIETKYGKNTTGWPQDWNFGRVIRNSFAHKGVVHFQNPSAPSVQWRGLAYSPADSGRNFMKRDLWPADLIYLMMDMDSHIT